MIVSLGWGRDSDSTSRAGAASRRVGRAGPVGGLRRKLVSLPVERMSLLACSGAHGAPLSIHQLWMGFMSSRAAGVGAAIVCSLPRERFLWHREGLCESRRCREAGNGE
jgi:hypothetical protein